MYCERAQQVSKILFLVGENKIHFFFYYVDTSVLLENIPKNYVFNVILCEIMENKPLGSLMKFFGNLTSGIFSSKTLMSI